MSRARKFASAFVAGEDGATMVEYALMLGLIALVCIVIITALGSDTRSLFNNPKLRNGLGS